MKTWSSDYNWLLSHRKSSKRVDRANIDRLSTGDKLVYQVRHPKLSFSTELKSSLRRLRSLGQKLQSGSCRFDLHVLSITLA